MPVHLFHYAKLVDAISIARTKIYLSASNNPLNADSGLNAGIVGQPLTEQHFEGKEVKLFFDFDGPVVSMTPFPLTLGSVYDALPWRAVVPLGTKTELRLVGLTLVDASWNEVIPAPPWHQIFDCQKNSWKQKKAFELEREILGVIAQKPLITVMGKRF